MAPKISQLISLEPGAADLLHKLAAKTKITKQVLLREAVDDLLAKRGMHTSEAYDELRDGLKGALGVVVHYEKRAEGYQCREALRSPSLRPRRPGPSRGIGAKAKG